VLQSHETQYNAPAWGNIYPMRFSWVGVFHQLRPKPSWCAVFFACLLVVPAALSQKPLQSPATPANAFKLVTTRDTNDRIAELAVASSAKQGDYVIGSGDLLGIEVFDVPELSRDVRVNESGLVSLPLIPVKIHAEGFTPFQLQDTIAELLQVNGLVNHPQVTVTVKERHGEPITVVGEVKSPMVIQAVGQVTLLEALSQAGGLASDAGAEVVVTRHPQVELQDPEVQDPQAKDPKAPAASNPQDAQPQPTAFTIDLNQLLNSGDPKYNIPLLGGDVVNVPRAGIVYAVGAVQHAGGFVLESDNQQMTVLKLLALTGGLEPTAQAHHAVILRQDGSAGQRQQIPVDVKKILGLKSKDVVLQASDILFVPDSIGRHALRKGGEVALSLATGAALYRVIY
jgi:polysaccharide biosynthesis/export protein